MTLEEAFAFAAEKTGLIFNPAHRVQQYSGKEGPLGPNVMVGINTHEDGRPHSISFDAAWGNTRPISKNDDYSYLQSAVSIIISLDAQNGPQIRAWTDVENHVILDHSDAELDNGTLDPEQGWTAIRNLVQSGIIKRTSYQASLGAEPA
ncbi:MAG: hypothetical protein AB7G06_09495 [Bdellovibrionales bacterium]